MACVIASTAVFLLCSLGRSTTRLGSRIAMSGIISFDASSTFLPSSSETTAAQLHSEPVPLVVGIAASLLFLLRFKLTRGVISYTDMSGLSYIAKRTFAVSIAEPPPTAINQSGEKSIILLRDADISAKVGSGFMSATTIVFTSFGMLISTLSMTLLCFRNLSVTITAFLMSRDDKYDSASAPNTTSGDLKNHIKPHLVKIPSEQE